MYTTQIDILGITDVFANMIIFAVGSSHEAPNAYLDPSVFAASLDSAYGLLSNVSNSDDATPTIKGQAKAVAVVRSSAITFEICLSLVAVLVFSLLILCWNRTSELRKDPAFVSSVLEIS